MLQLSICLLLVLFVCASLASCGPSTDYSCRVLDTTTFQVTSCIDYQSGFSDTDVLATCSGEGLDVSTFRCPGDAIARCVVSTDGGTFTQHYYPPFTLDLAQMICRANGDAATFEVP